MQASSSGGRGAKPGGGRSSPFGRFFHGRGNSSRSQSGSESSASNMSSLSASGSGGAGAAMVDSPQGQKQPKSSGGLSALFWGGKQRHHQDSPGGGASASSGEAPSSGVSSHGSPTPSAASSSNQPAAPATAGAGGPGLPPRGGAHANKVDYYPGSSAAAPVSGAGGPLKTEEKELPVAMEEEEMGGDEGLLCILDVAYAPGQVDQIPVRVGDKASALAEAFAAKHGLDATTRGILEEYIAQSVDDILCVLDVAYAEGHVDRIPVHVGDEPGALAAAFAAKHGLDADAQQVLEEFISQSVDQHMAARVVLAEAEAEAAAAAAAAAAGEGYLDQYEETKGDEYGYGSSRPATPTYLSPTSASSHRRREQHGQQQQRSPSRSPSPTRQQQQQQQQQQQHFQYPSLPQASPTAAGAAARARSPHGGGREPLAPGSSSPSEGGEALFNRLKQAWRSTRGGSASGGGHSSSYGHSHSAAAAASPSGPYTPASFSSTAYAGTIPAPLPGSPTNGQPPSVAHLRAYSSEPEAGKVMVGRRRRAQPQGFREQRANIVPEGKAVRAPWGQPGGKHAGYETAASGVPEAFERLYAEAVALRRRKEEAVKRQAYLEQRERRERRKAVLKRVRAVLGGAVNGRYAVDNYDGAVFSATNGAEENWGERLYLAGKRVMQRRLELWRSKAKEGPDVESEGYQDWVCPKCFHTNSLAAATCQRVSGRYKSLFDQAPHEWVRVPADATRLHGRRIAGDNEIYRCGQPRPPLFQPTIVSLQQYSAVYAQPLPIAVRLRPENVFEELYARRFLAEQKLRALKLEREEEESAECTFAPAISERSRLLVEARERAMLEGDLAISSGLDLTLGEDSEAWKELTPEEQARRRELRMLQRADAMHRGGYIRRDYHANCALQPEYPFQPNIGVDRYWAPPDFYPSNGSYGYEPDSPRPDAAGSTAGGFSVTSALTATHRLTGRTQQQPLLHRVPRQDDGVFVRLAEDDLVKRERNLAALTMEVRKEETFMPITTGVVPPQRVLDEAEDVCEYLYAEGMASLQRKKEQERHHAVELREKASAKYTRGISEALVRVMKERAYANLFVSLFPNPELASKETRLDLAAATLERVKDPGLLKALVLVLGRKGDPAAEEALRAAQRHMKAAAPAAWTDRITSDKWYASMEKKGPHAPGQPLAVNPADIGPRRPQSPTPKPSMLPTGGFPANAGTFPTLQKQPQPPTADPSAASRPQTSTSPTPASPPRSHSPSPPHSPERAREIREQQQRDIVLSLQSPVASPAQQQQPQQQPPSSSRSRPSPSPSQQPQPLSHSVGSPGSSCLLLGTKRRSLAFPEFCRRLERFLPPVGIPGPGFLYTHSCDPNKERNRHLTFRPRINPRSEEIMADRWRARRRTEVFDLLHAEGEMKVKRLEEARREKASHMLDECTFRPFLFTYRGGGQPHYRYPGEKVWVQHVAATPRSRSAFAVERRGRFEAPRPRSTPPVRLKGLGVYNKESTPTHDWPKPVDFGRGHLRPYLDTHDDQDPGRKSPVWILHYRPPTTRPGSIAPLRGGGRASGGDGGGGEGASSSSLQPPALAGGGRHHHHARSPSPGVPSPSV